MSLAFLYLPARSLRVFAALPNCTARPSEASTSPTADTGSIPKEVKKTRYRERRGS